MKKLVLLVLMTLISVVGFSCNVKFLINGQEKFDKNKVYNIGEEINITILVEYIHHPCQIELEDTKLKLEGIEIVKKGKWKLNEETNMYSLDIVVKILPDYSKEGKLILTRTCTNEGGFGMLKFKH